LAAARVAARSTTSQRLCQCAAWCRLALDARCRWVAPAGATRSRGVLCHLVQQQCNTTMPLGYMHACASKAPTHACLARATLSSAATQRMNRVTSCRGWALQRAGPGRLL
jgi:hypothetical protein